MRKTDGHTQGYSGYDVDRRTFLQAAGTTIAGAVAHRASAGEVEADRKGEQPMLRVAMLSGWHAHARGYGEAIKKMPDADVTVVWDEDPGRGEGWSKRLEAVWVKDLEEVFAREDVDAVAINAPTNRHAEIMIAAANSGKHIFTEKVMALTVAECARIADAVRGNNVKFCISFPYRTRPETLYAHQAVQDGLLGQLTSLRVRVAHNGGCGGWLPPHFWDPVACGGGTMMDLGAHPMYLARWIGGQPKRISSTFNYMMGKEVEDNAVSVIEFEIGVIGVSETSFMSTNNPFSLELSGTEGTLIVGGPDEHSVLIRSNKLDPRSWVKPEVLPDPLPAPIQQWVDGVLRDTPIAYGLEEGTQLTELMEYAYIAHRESRQIEIPKRV